MEIADSWLGGGVVGWCVQKKEWLFFCKDDKRTPSGQRLLILVKEFYISHIFVLFLS